MIFTHKKTQLIDEHDEHVHNDNVLDHGNSLAASDDKVVLAVAVGVQLGSTLCTAVIEDSVSREQVQSVEHDLIS